jgi:predicted transcriptional regulator
LASANAVGQQPYIEIAIATIGTKNVTQVAVGGISDVVKLAGEIVIAYIGSNPVPKSEVSDFIQEVYATVSRIAGGQTNGARGAVPVFVSEQPSPDQIRASIQDDGLVSFIDGKRYKSLKRHLAAKGLDARAYRERFGLGADYPMVAPSYAAERAAIARRIGLGQPGAMGGTLAKVAEAPARAPNRKAPEHGSEEFQAVTATRGVGMREVPARR